MRVVPPLVVLAALRFAPFSGTWLPVARAQERSVSPAALQFEVASIKPSSGGRGGHAGLSTNQARYLRYEAENNTLNSLIIDAYKTTFDGVIGGPSWVRQAFFDVNAKPERPGTADELRAMLQNLLADRFKLQIHRQVVELPVYYLVTDKDGPRMTPSSNDALDDPIIERTPDVKDLHEVKIKVSSVPTKYLERLLRWAVDRPIIDKTGLTGKYDFDLRFAEDVPEEVVARHMEQGRPIVLRPTIFEALRQQLGLRLDPGKGPVEKIVIDHAEKPSEN
jgi:uncharacterized protein (TIGR03435 family)